MGTPRWFPLALPLLLVACSESSPAGLEPSLPQVGDAAAASHSAAFPQRIWLPNGFQPEGITVGSGTTFFVGSLAGPYMGAVYRGDLRTGEGSILVAPAANTRQAVGLNYDPRSGNLYVAGGGLSLLDAYHGNSGAHVASVTVPGMGLSNDLVITRTAIYLTDSFRAVLYRVPLGPAGRLMQPIGVQEIQLGGDYVFDPGVPFGINNNGIVASADGRHLIVVNYGTGTLYRVNPSSGHAVRIEIGAALPFADGLVLQGRTLYAVQNFLNQVAVIELAPGFASGTLTRYITSPYLRIPTTAAAFGNSLYAVNARFDVASPFEPGDYSAVDFDVVRLPR